MTAVITDRTRAGFRKAACSAPNDCTFRKEASMILLPERFDDMVEHGLKVVKNGMERNTLRAVAQTIMSNTWQHWQAWRQREDNRQEHEWVVFADVMGIAECEQLALSEKRIAVAFAFTHDTFFIPRIMKSTIRDM